jgi:hypothetical protein
LILTDRNVVSAGTKQKPSTLAIQQADNNGMRKKKISLEITIAGRKSKNKIYIFYFYLFYV